LSEKKLELSGLVQTGQGQADPAGEAHKDLTIVVCGDLPKERTVLILGGKK